MDADAKKSDRRIRNISIFAQRSATSTVTPALSAKFLEQMSKFYVMAKETYEGLEKKFKEAEKDYEIACLKYCEEPKTTAPEEFFGIFTKFCQAYTAAKKENLASEAKLAQDKKRDEAKQAAELRKQNKNKDCQINEESPPQVVEGLDDLISSIRTGKAFQDKSKGGSLLSDGDSNSSIKKLRKKRESISIQNKVALQLPISKSNNESEPAERALSFQNAERGVGAVRIKRAPTLGMKSLAEKLG